MGRREMGAQWLLQPLTLWRPSSAPGNQENTFPFYTGLRDRISLHPLPCLELVPGLGQGFGGGDPRAQSRHLWVGGCGGKSPQLDVKRSYSALCLCSRVDLRPESPALGSFPSPSDRPEEGGGAAPPLWASLSSSAQPCKDTSSGWRPPKKILTIKIWVTYSYTIYMLLVKHT